MKYFKLGLLAVTLSLTALVIALDKKENRKNNSEVCEDFNDDNQNEEAHTIIVEEYIENDK